MGESLNVFVIMKMNGVVLWILYILPKIIYSIFKHWSKFKDLNYFLLFMLISKICADISLVSAMFLNNNDLEILSCGIYSIYFTLKLTLDYIFTTNFIFYQETPLSQAVFLICLMLFIYFSITMYIIFPFIMTFILPAFLFAFFILLKIKRNVLMSELRTLTELLYTNGWIDQVNYTELYMKLNPTSNIFYIFHIFEIVFFYYESSDYYAFISFIYEFLFFIDNCTVASHFLCSDVFFDNPISSQSLIESNRPKLYEITLDGSLILSLGQTLAFVTPGTHEILIAEPIEEYLIYI